MVPLLFEASSAIDRKEQDMVVFSCGIFFFILLTEEIILHTIQIFKLCTANFIIKLHFLNCNLKNLTLIYVNSSGINGRCLVKKKKKKEKKNNTESFTNFFLIIIAASVNYSLYLISGLVFTFLYNYKTTKVDPYLIYDVFQNQLVLHF